MELGPQPLSTLQLGAIRIVNGCIQLDQFDLLNHFGGKQRVCIGTFVAVRLLLATLALANLIGKTDRTACFSFSTFLVEQQQSLAVVVLCHAVDILDASTI